MLRSPNVATPFAALTVSAPDNVPLAGFVPIAIVTAPVNDDTTLPEASSAATCTAGVIVCPPWVVWGWTANWRCVAGGGGVAVMSNGWLVAGARPVAVARSV